MSKKNKKIKYGLNKRTTYAASRSFLDFDYLDSLSEEERNWLATFSAEYYQNTFTGTDEDLHNEEQRRQCYNDYNARYRDIWNRWTRYYVLGSGIEDGEYE